MENFFLKLSKFIISKSFFIPTFLALVASLSILFGSLHARYNIDVHHWGYIAGSILDYINGQEPYSEIFMQYGSGQAFIFKILSYLIPINYTSVGIVTELLYAFRFLILYVTLRKFSSTKISIIVVAVYFLLHPFSICPWPDYFAGHFISMFCYIYFNREGDFRLRDIVAMSGILFAACFIRNTYFVSIGLAIICFLAYGMCRRFEIIKELKHVFGLFVVLLGLYLCFLKYESLLDDWYLQGFGAASAAYQIGFYNILAFLMALFIPNDFGKGIYSLLFIINVYYLISPYVGFENGRIFYRLSALILLLLLSISMLCGFSNVQSFCVQIEIYLILFVLLKYCNWNMDKGGDSARFPSSVIIFPLLLGLMGYSQGLYHYEVFRLQNSCYPLFLTSTYIFTRNKNIEGKCRLGVYTIIILCLTIASLLTHISRDLVDYRISFRVNDSGDSLGMPFFDGHIFDKEMSKYYKSLERCTCKTDKKILNLTLDSTLPYICLDKKRVLIMPFYAHFALNHVDYNEANRIKLYKFKEDELIISDQNLPKIDEIILNEVCSFNRPNNIPYMEGGMIHVYAVARKERT